MTYGVTSAFAHLAVVAWVGFVGCTRDPKRRTGDHVNPTVITYLNIKILKCDASASVKERHLFIILQPPVLPKFKISVIEIDGGWPTSEHALLCD